MPRERSILWFLLAAIFAIRAIHPDQPIVENYVGRQIPTAMVARNLERGSGFLHPQLDTGPFPNLFLVEPPIYAQLVACVHPLDWVRFGSDRAIGLGRRHDAGRLGAVRAGQADGKVQGWLYWHWVRLGFFPS